MTGFVQIVEFRTSRIEDIKNLAAELGPAPDELLRRTVTADRDRPGHYVMIAEFDSYETAMQNSASPQTSGFATRMATLCDEPPTFYNLDVIDTGDESGGPSKKLIAAAAVGVGVAAAAIKSKTGNDSDADGATEVRYEEVAVSTPVTETTSNTTRQAATAADVTIVPESAVYPDDRAPGL